MNWLRKAKEEVLKVKVGDTTYSSETEPIMVILSKKDKENIANMAEDATKYCMYPDDYSKEDIDKFMKKGPELEEESNLGGFSQNGIVPGFMPGTNTK